MKKVIIVGASSGIGKALAKIFSENDCLVGVTGRRTPMLEEVKRIGPGPVLCKTFDVTETSSVESHLDSLVQILNGLDLLIISAGTGELNEQLEFSLEKPCIDTNVSGFTCVADWAFRFFEKQKAGQLAAITSLAGLRGGRVAPAYNASKAYQINYLEGLRQKATRLKLPIVVTEIRAGFVDTEMAKGEGKFWVAPVDKAAKQIFNSIQRRKKVAYVTRRYKLLGVLLKVLPRFMYDKF